MSEGLLLKISTERRREGERERDRVCGRESGRGRAREGGDLPFEVFKEKVCGGARGESVYSGH